MCVYWVPPSLGGDDDEIAYFRLRALKYQKPSLVYRTKNHELKPISTGPISRGSQSGVSMADRIYQERLVLSLE